MASGQAARRIELQETTDSRVQNTRDRLIKAYRSSVVADAGPVSVLTVCRAAGIARSTFYTHYETIEDLAVASIADAFTAASPLDVRRRISHDVTSADITRASLTQMITALEDQRTIIITSTGMASRAAVVERLIADLAPAVRSAINAEDPNLGDSAVTVTTEFLAAGTVYATLRWLEQEERDPQAIVEHLMQLMPTLLVGRSMNEADR